MNKRNIKDVYYSHFQQQEKRGQLFEKNLAHEIFYMLPDELKMQILFSSVLQGNLLPVCRVRKKGFDPL